MRKSVLAVLLGAAVILPTASAGAIFRLPAGDAARAAGLQLFVDHCAACHSRAGVAKGFAPYLVGVVGRRAGSAPGFSYSPALRNSGIVWSEDNLMKWIANAPAMVPGTPMPHVSISDPAERLFIVEYLKGLRR
jgi:cytochrome c